MAEIEIRCSLCGQLIHCDEDNRGLEVNCPTCKGWFLIPTVQYETSAPITTPQESPPILPTKSSPKKLSAFWGICILLAVIIIPIFTIMYSFDVSWQDVFGGKSRKDANTPQKPSIIVKGFYIGMPEEEVLATLKVMPGIYNDTNSLAVMHYAALVDELHVEGANDYIDTAVEIPGENFSTQNTMRFDLDSNKKTLVYIAWDRDAVNVLFNSAKLNDEEFAQQFANSYHIPEFKHRQDSSGLWQWVYTSPENIVITIWQSKSLRIKKGGKPASRS